MGEILRLRSGGPPMTVTWLIPEDGVVVCRWFWRGRIFHSEFHPEHLEPAKADTPGT